MRNRIIIVTAAASGLFGLSALPAAAAPGGAAPATARAGQVCTNVQLSGALPAPPAGLAVQQEVTIGADCKPRLGAVRLVPATGARAVPRAAAAGAATRQVKSWSEMYDCCNIRMTGLSTTSTWNTEGNRITTAATEARQEWNREPWNAGWSLKSSSKTADCLTDCTVSRNEAHAEFSYKGIFDTTGDWYANKHHSYVDLKADGTASCRFDVELKHSFVGWNLQRGCA
ncbi:hypothetical protein OG897_19800 [Streptomyces sp. NBC_00237]|uniref:hypothetical protein n=1 Tax=Streptomyces sp. NBC_00237 TaxID=2975687 RepID=UPI00224FAD88|nr:hypothetical protein [Streptomyces sp. NBC_00237]MCX5203688.1 hypothetical protein [Streptomyces sp. NBC_00237]